VRFTLDGLGMLTGLIAMKGSRDAVELLVVKET